MEKFPQVWELIIVYKIKSMEEKLAALEALGAFKGLISTKQWNVHSLSVQHILKPQSTRALFQSKRNNVIVPNKYGSSLMINQNSMIWLDQRPPEVKEKLGEETEQDIPLKQCREMETEKSEFDIPKKNETIMNLNCDEKFLESEGKPEGFCGLKYTGINPTLKKKNSSDETSEEIESSESEEANLEIAVKKTPSAVLEWVNHLPLKGSIFSKENADCSEPKEEHQGIPLNEDKPSFKAELSREASLQSSSSLDSILDSRRPDPVEIFLNLGFGGLPGIDTENCRIPKRFLVPSKCKGGDWNEFLNRELIQAQNFECSSLGFRGLSGPSYRRPSAIVANIMEKLRERAAPPTHNRSRFSAVAKMVLNEKSVLNKLTPEFQSVLSPDSRKFLQNQGKKSPEVPRRRIIFGQKSFAFAHDGEFVEVESTNIEEKTTKEPPTTLTTSDGEDPTVYTNPEVLLKLRRSSFQKQKKVEEDPDVDDVFYVLDKEESPVEPLYNNSIKKDDDDNDNNNNNECSKKAGKIPRRFLSSGNLKGLEENKLSDTIRLEVEKEILSLSQKIKSMSSQDLSCVLQQVKELRSKIENSSQESTEM